MHRLRQGSVGALVLLAVLALLLGACGGDDGDDEGASSDFCVARVGLEDRISELEGFDLTSEEDLPEARERVIALVDALRTMLDAAPEEIRVDADTMADGLDDIEAQIEEASELELPNVVPSLLAEIGGGGSDEQQAAIANVNSYAAETCD